MKKFLTILFLMIATGAVAEPIQGRWARASDWDITTLMTNPRFAQAVHAADGKEGLARIGWINRAVNQSIRYVNEDVDYWASPAETFTTGTGDCEDFALAKMAVLEAIGIKSTLIVLRRFDGANHAMVAVEFEGKTYYLDNRNLMLATSLPTGYILTLSFKRG